jgi:hypothetical protein
MWATSLWTVLCRDFCKNGDVCWFIAFYNPNYCEISCDIPWQNHKGSPSVAHLAVIWWWPFTDHHISEKNGWFHEWIVSKVQSNFQASQHDFFLVKMVSHVGKMGTHVDLYGETMSHPWCDGRCSGHQALSFSFRSATSWETRAPWPGRCVTCLSKIKVIGVRHSSTALGIYENTKWLFHSHAVPVTVTSGKLT